MIFNELMILVLGFSCFKFMFTEVSKMLDHPNEVDPGYLIIHKYLVRNIHYVLCLSTFWDTI